MTSPATESAVAGLLEGCELQRSAKVNAFADGALCR